MKRQINAFWSAVSVVNGVCILILAVTYIFNLHPLGIVIPQNSYLYLLLGFALFQVFMVYPACGRFEHISMPLDIGFGILSFAVAAYFARHGYDITAQGWSLMPPNEWVTWLCVLFAVLVLEAMRRVAGFVLFLLCTLLLLFPIFAGQLPPPLFGTSFTMPQTFAMQVMDAQSLVGIPLTVTGTLLIGYLVFGVVLNRTGGAQFFLDGANALMGRYRGGAGKVAVLASGLFGSMSGSSISNVITVGTVTIPAMKRTGFKSHEAGAIEACASTGGMLMPPVMGAVAFLMAQFLQISYFSVVIAAAIPSLLFYTGLILILDSRAARKNIAGVPRAELPSGKQILVHGWPYLATLVLLTYLLYLRIEAEAPFWAILLLLGATLVFRRKAIEPGWTALTLKEISISVSELIAMIGAVGFIIGAMSMTGVGTALSHELVALAGHNRYLMLIMGAVASFVLGMGLSASACYIFLAVVLAPSLVSFGFNEIGVHLFILYWAIVSNITPPVALACFPAARIAEAPYFKVGFQAVAFGFVCYIVPFAFVFNPELILIGSPLAIVMHIGLAFLGLTIASFGIGRHAPCLGNTNFLMSIFLVTMGIVIMLCITIWSVMVALALTMAVVGVYAALATQLGSSENTGERNSRARSAIE